MKKIILILFALPLLFLFSCKQQKENKEETVPSIQEIEIQDQAIIEEAEKTFKVQVVDQFSWKQGEHLIQVVNVENEDQGNLVAFASKIPVNKSLYIYCFKGNAPTLDASQKANDSVQGAIAVKNFIKGKGPVVTLYKNANGPEIVYKEGFAE